MMLQKFVATPLAAVAAFIAAVVFAGCTGLIFYVWPTGLIDHKLAITPEVIQRLRDLQSERKFEPDPMTFYPGARNETERAAAQAAVDATIASLITQLPAHPRRSTVLGTMKVALANFDTVESEERDRLLGYFTQIMEICGVQSSAELFNVWRYGFPYGWFL
ncbi:protein of unknown function [Duganella sacchari]|uniref:DUF4844 domain-containing protein n=1 Tax=Duganella sacchari TaxID=551987 RepID=A0A1M7KGF7_9BURK|nr:DUF4844 domain-containing protein [Duganella sacchari]SHM64365.1 protein of unknown function [Duganella sacchari]